VPVQSPEDRVPLVELIGTFPATSAIFTTFTLSLTWFEAYLLRPLQRSGVRDICLLADPVGVADAVTEGLAAGPGVQYALEPVRLPTGAFHPKVALLWSDSAALVAVGSGNLTWSGMMRNLEQWDVLVSSPSAHRTQRLSAEIADSVAGFLDNLQIFVPVGGRSARLLSRGATAFRGLVSRLPSRDDITWLDSTETPVGKGMSEVVPPGNERHLQVLSPFHADGRSTGELAKRLGAATIDILYTAGVTSFPADDWSDSPVETRQLVLPEKETTRPLHAKVVRLQGGAEDWLLTGSANATWKGMWTEDNIEVCLLRRGSHGSFDVLLNSTPGIPAIVRVDDPAGKPRPLGINWARADQKRVALELDWSGDSTQRPTHVVARVLLAGEPRSTYSWPADGILEVPLPRGFDPVRPVASRVEVLAAEGCRRHRAVAWVAFDVLLDASPAWRAAMRAWNSLLDDEGVDGLSNDDRALLDLFSRKHSEVVVRLGGGKKASSAEKAAETDEVPVPLAILQSLAAGRAGDTIGGSWTGGGASGFVERATAALVRALSGGGAPGKGQPRGDKKPRVPRALSKNAREAIEAFEGAFLERTRVLDDDAVEDPDEVLAYATFCCWLTMAYHLRDADRRGFWRAVDSFVRVLLFPRSGIQRGPLLKGLGGRPDRQEQLGEALTLMLALLKWRAEGGRLNGTDEADPNLLLRGGALRRALATLEQTAAPQPRLPALPKDLENAVGGDAAVLEASLSNLENEAVPGRRSEELASLLDDHTLPLPADVSRDETAMLASRGQRRSPVVIAPWSTTCPSCYMRLPTVASSRLVRWEIAQCNCGRWLVPVEPS